MTLEEYGKLTRQEQVKLGAEMIALSAAVHGRRIVLPGQEEAAIRFIEGTGDGTPQRSAAG